MFSFIALGSMLQCVGTKNQGGYQFTGKVAKTAKFGTLDYNAFLSKREELRRLSIFAQSAAQAMEAAQQSPSFPLIALSVQLQNAYANSQTIVDRWLITEYAKKAGLVADADAGKQYLQFLIQNSLDVNALTSCLRAAGLNETTLLDLLREQIAYERCIRRLDGGMGVEQLQEMMLGVVSESQIAFGHGSVAAAPAEALQAYAALNQTAKASVATFRAADYADQVADPSEGDLRKFYEQYKDVVANAYSKTPGFTQPTRIAFEVVRAEITSDVLDAIPAEEVQKYYDEHKEEYKKPKAQAAPAAVPSEDTLELPGAGSATVIPDDMIDAFGGDDAATTEEAAAPAAEDAAPVEDVVPAEEAASVDEAPAKPEVIETM
ncbi:MAG: hypothetical protein HUK22_07045, partial [Thermoguttaceae bacterium]|nr:hypothetical protein [Thermoguttaceae bacterium]